jgi:hypothetical protein
MKFTLTSLLQLEGGNYWLAISRVLANIMIWVFPLFPEMWQKLRMQISYHDMPDTLGRLFCTYLHPLLEADEVSG